MKIVQRTYFDDNLGSSTVTHDDGQPIVGHGVMLPTDEPMVFDADTIEFVVCTFGAFTLNGERFESGVTSRSSQDPPQPWMRGVWRTQVVFGAVIEAGGKVELRCAEDHEYAGYIVYYRTWEPIT